jgi:hypothetical protein
VGVRRLAIVHGQGPENGERQEPSHIKYHDGQVHLLGKISHPSLKPLPANQENKNDDEWTQHIRQFANGPVQLCLARLYQQGLYHQQKQPAHQQGTMNVDDDGFVFEEGELADVMLVKAPLDPEYYEYGKDGRVAKGFGHDGLVEGFRKYGP